LQQIVLTFYFFEILQLENAIGLLFEERKNGFLGKNLEINEVGVIKRKKEKNCFLPLFYILIST